MARNNTQVYAYTYVCSLSHYYVNINQYVSAQLLAITVRIFTYVATMCIRMYMYARVYGFYNQPLEKASPNTS